MKLVTTLKRTKALFFTQTEELVVAKGNKIYLRKNNDNVVHLFSFKENFIKRLIGRIPLVSRLMRFGVISAIATKKEYFFTYGKEIYCYDVEAKELNKELSIEKGRGPLQFCSIENIAGFEDSVCFGEYYGNHARLPVNIFQRTSASNWKNVFQFKNGEINHVHALIPDRFNQCVWLLVGDFEHSAAIYKATDNFKNIELIVKGKQCYRACVAFPTADGLLYATDTQLEPNSIRKLIKTDNGWKSEKLFDLNGSCIYGCEVKDYFIFSTSTEPSDKSKNLLHALLDNKPGPGIIENKSDIVSYCKKTNKCNVELSRQKDLFPYRLFQFGAIMFPTGINTSNLIVTYNVANRKNDLSTEIFQL